MTQLLLKPGKERSAQEEVSGTEHIDFAVQSLVQELERQEGRAPSQG